MPTVRLHVRHVVIVRRRVKGIAPRVIQSDVLHNARWERVLPFAYLNAAPKRLC